MSRPKKRFFKVEYKYFEFTIKKQYDDDENSVDSDFYLAKKLNKLGADGWSPMEELGREVDYGDSSEHYSYYGIFKRHII